MVSTMAARKKSDGGAARSEGRKRAQNKRQEAKYGLQGFTAQANRNLATSRVIPRAQETAMAGLGLSAGSAIGQAGLRVASRIGSRVGGRLANRIGSGYLADSMAVISRTKRGTVSTPKGPRRMTPAELKVRKKGLSTIASNQAARVASAVDNQVTSLVTGAVKTGSRIGGNVVAGASVASAKKNNRSKGSKTTKR